MRRVFLLLGLLGLASSCLAEVLPLPALLDGANSTPLLLIISACAYFFANTAPVSVVIAMSENISVRKIWKETYFWSLPYYLIGAAVVGVVSFITGFLLSASGAVAWLIRARAQAVSSTSTALSGNCRPAR